MSARTVIAFLILASLVACKKSEQTSATQSSTAPTAKTSKWGANGPCSWLTDAEASALFGEPSKQVIDPTTNNCDITPVDLYYHVSNNTGSYSFMKASKKAEDISGIGDKAVYEGGSLAVVKGERCVNIGVSVTSAKKQDQAELKKKEMALAQKIVERM